MLCFHTGGEETSSGSQAFNPPFVNAVAMPSTADAGLGHVVAVARGDGAVALHDVRGSNQRSAPRGREGTASEEPSTLCMLRPAQGGYAPVNSV